MQNVIKLSVVILNVLMLSAVLSSAVILSVAILSVIMLSVVILSINLLNVVAPKKLNQFLLDLPCLQTYLGLRSTSIKQGTFNLRKDIKKN
jgi:hypothetical protein